MSDPILRAAVICCGLGMGVWPTVQRNGCCCATPREIADILRDAECRERIPCAAFTVDIPAPIKMFEFVPAYAIKNYTEDYRDVEAVFTSVFQQAGRGSSNMWEVVENIPPAGVPRHVLFCTTFDEPARR